MESEQPDDLIRQYIEPNPHRPGAADARLRKYGVSVWALIDYLKGVCGDVSGTAVAYDVPVEAVEAARADYERHREVIDARIAANVAEQAWRPSAYSVFHNRRGRP